MTKRTAETITFDHMLHFRAMDDVIHSPYAGFTWNNIGVANTKYHADTNSGYQKVSHGHGHNVAFNTSGEPGSFSSTTDFSLKSGHFAAAWRNDLKVEFTALKDGVEVGHKIFTLDQVDTVLKFNDAFKHIDTVAIRTWGGEEVAGQDGQGPHIAIDNLKVIFDGDIPTGEPASSGPADVPLSAADLMGFAQVPDWFV